MLSRFVTVLVMGGIALALIGSLALTAPVAAAAAIPLIALLSIAALAAIIVTGVRSRTVKAAWGRLCLVNGVLSVMLAAVSIGIQKEPYWPSGSSYQHDIASAVGAMPPTQTLWALAAYFAFVALAVAAILFVFSYWLLHPRH